MPALDMNNLTCPRCRRSGLVMTEAREDFYRNSAQASGLSAYCRPCTRAYRAERRGLAAAVGAVGEAATEVAAANVVVDAAAFAEFRFGVEIEASNIGIGRASEVVAAAVGGNLRLPDGRAWTVVPDGSVPGGCETVSPILTFADMDMLQKVVRAIRAAGGRADSNCGLHVHVGAEALSPRQLGGLATVAYECQDLVFQALRVANHRAGHTCKKLDVRRVVALAKSRTRESLNRAWYQSSRVQTATKYDSSRYHAINFNSYFLRGTAEFRFFNGTLHAGRVKAAVQLAVAMMAYAKRGGRAAVQTTVYPGSSNTEGVGTIAQLPVSRASMVALLDRIGLVAGEFDTARHHLLASWDEGDEGGAFN